MCFGGKPDDPEPSAQEIALAERALQDDALYQRVFQPLEGQAIERLSDPVALARRTAGIEGRANADVAQAAASARESGLRDAAASGLDSGAALAAIGDVSLASGQAQADARTDAQTVAQGLRDRDRLDVIQTGKDLQRSVTSGLAAGARRATARAITDLEAEQAKHDARMTAIGQIAGTAAGLGLRRYMAGRQRAQIQGDRNAANTAAVSEGLRGPTSESLVTSVRQANDRLNQHLGY